jgi:hypothetical protein
MKTILGVVAIMIGLSGCYNGRVLKADLAARQAEGEVARLVVMRASVRFGAATGAVLTVDDAPVAVMGAGAFAEIRISPGVHRVAVRFGNIPGPEWVESADLVAAAGQAYYLRYTYGMHASLVQLSEHVGAEEITENRYTKLPEDTESHFGDPHGF